ncbi:MAG: hypothetical protein JW795_07425 [Chitinivibrionales bacterium]|nr:hypothetical protein [Chitinivibrionales bacterium]
MGSIRRGLANQQGSALIFVLVIGITFFFISMVTTKSAQQTNKVQKTRLQAMTAFNIAEAGIEHQSARLREGVDTLLQSRGGVSRFLDNILLNNGSYSVTCSSATTRDTAWLVSTGLFKENSSIVGVSCQVKRYAARPNGWANGAIVSRSDVDLAGTIIVDGRDHNDLGVVIAAAPGVPGIQSCASVTLYSGAQQVGGLQLMPAFPPLAGAIVQNANAVNYPTTPEAVLSLPQNFLDVYRSADKPPTTFSDTVIYCNGSVRVAQMNGSGIFICHNSTMDAELQLTGNVTFKGIIIADKINRVNGNLDILGAVMTLSPTTGSTIFGNGTATINYSSTTLESLKNIILQSKKRIVSLISWQQLK